MQQEAVKVKVRLSGRCSNLLLYTFILRYFILAIY